jgi:hypothetical protein
VADPRTSAAAAAPSGQRITVTPVIPRVSEPWPREKPGRARRPDGEGSGGAGTAQF